MTAFTAGMSPSAIALGAILGGIGDQQLNALLFKGDDPEPPRLNDMGIGSSSPGAPIARVFGQGYGRTPGIVVWRGAPQYKSQSTGTKGGGVGNQEIKQDLAVLLTFNGDTPVPLKGIRRIWGNGELLYQIEVDVDETDNGFTQFINTDGGGDLNYELGDGIIETDADLSTLRVENGAKVTVSLAGANNAEYVIYGHTLLASGRTRLIVKLAAIGDSITNDTTAGVRFVQDNNEWRAGTLNDANFHLGDQTTADGYMTTQMGADDAPVWEGFAYVVLRKFNLSRWGYRPPTFEFELMPAAGHDTPSETITELLTQAGLAAEEMDVSGVNDTNLQQFEFYPIRGAQGTGTAIEPLLLNGWLYAWESAGKLHVSRRGILPSVSVETGDLSAHVDGDIFPGEIDVDNDKELDVPSRAEIDFQDSAADGLDGNTGYESAAAVASGVDSSLTIRMPMTISVDKAREIAKRLVLQGITDRRMVKFPMPWSVGRITAATRIYFQTTSGISIKVLVTNVSKGRNGIYEVEGMHSITIDREFIQAGEPS